jgi:multidrug efflux system membrane fusion protein
MLLPAALPLLGTCRNAEKEPPKAPPPAPVFVAAAEQRAAPVEIHTIGTVQPYTTVAVKPRVGGQITHVGFREGQDVKHNDVLFTIDRRALEAALHQAEANLGKDKAMADKAAVDKQRYEKLYAAKTVSEEDLLEMTTRVETMRETIKAGEAAVEAATVLLDYATIRAPIDGRTGDLLVDEGNVIKADDATPLVVINQITPIYVAFAVAEDYLAEIRRHMDQRPLEVRALPPKETAPLTGKLTFLDNTVDRATGTIQLKATFENADRRLWPGQFVDVVLKLTEIADAIFVPSEAVQTGQKGEYVFVVGAENQVEMRPVAVQMQIGNESVIAKGVKKGEVVVTDGHMKLVPGGKVAIKERDPQ